MKSIKVGDFFISIPSFTPGRTDVTGKTLEIGGKCFSGGQIADLELRQLNKEMESQASLSNELDDISDLLESLQRTQIQHLTITEPSVPKDIGEPIHQDGSINPLEGIPNLFLQEYEKSDIPSISI